MKIFCCFRWLLAAAIAASLPVTTRAATGHGMGGFSGGGPHVSMGHGFDHPVAFRHDHRFFDHHRFVDRDHFFFRRHRHIFIAFDFAAFGFPWWYPYPYYGWYPYDYSYSDYRPAYDDQYWNNLAVSVQSALASRGYYYHRIDGVIGADSIQAIREFQAAQGLPVTGLIDPKLLKALGISYQRA
jgi:Putative peptidoglycan binding domain